MEAIVSTKNSWNGDSFLVLYSGKRYKIQEEEPNSNKKTKFVNKSDSNYSKINEFKRFSPFDLKK